MAKKRGAQQAAFCVHVEMCDCNRHVSYAEMFARELALVIAPNEYTKRIVYYPRKMLTAISVLNGKICKSGNSYSSTDVHSAHHVM